MVETLAGGWDGGHEGRLKDRFHEQPRRAPHALIAIRGKVLARVAFQMARYGWRGVLRNVVGFRALSDLFFLQRS